MNPEDEFEDAFEENVQMITPRQSKKKPKPLIREEYIYSMQ